MKFSVLISVYYKDNPIHLSQSLRSICEEQNLKPSEIILVKDGLLSEELEIVIASYQKKFPFLFKIIPLLENKGLSNALNVGAKYCNCDLIARMDADDIAFPDRFEKQIKFLLEKNLDIVGGQIIEFGENINDVMSVRKVPTEHHDIVTFLKYRSPFSHPTVIFKKNVFDTLNGYNEKIFPEDYDFFVRAYLEGFKFGNVSDNVLWFRIGKDKGAAIKRRWGKQYAIKEFNLYKNFLNLGYYTYFDFFKVIVVKLPLRLMPFPIFKFIYFKILR